MIDREKLKKYAGELGVDLTEKAVSELDCYSARLLEINKSVNLTAITDPDEFLLKHIVDCLTVFAYVDIPPESKLIDVGTGGGFPGMIIRIVRPDVDVTLLDSTGKKLRALSGIAEEMDIGVRFLHARAEEAGRDSAHREKYDIAAARAVAGLNTLCEYCLPFVKVGGRFLSMKGASAREELKQAGSAIGILGAEVSKISDLELFGAGERSLIEIKKIRPTDKKYPRPGTRIARDPL